MRSASILSAYRGTEPVRVTTPFLGRHADLGRVDAGLPFQFVKHVVLQLGIAFHFIIPPFELKAILLTSKVDAEGGTTHTLSFIWRESAHCDSCPLHPGKIGHPQHEVRDSTLSVPNGGAAIVVFPESKDD